MMKLLMLFFLISALLSIAIAFNTTKYRGRTSSRAENCEYHRDFLLKGKDYIQRSSESFSEWLRIQNDFIDSDPVYENPSQEGTKHQRFNLVGPVNKLCKHPLESYGEGDDEKRACGLSLLAKNGTNDSSCVIFSIGSCDKWGFEEAVVNKTNCKIETFDCTLSKSVEVPNNLQGRVRLHKICLGNADETRTFGGMKNLKFMTWKSILNYIGFTGQPTFLKMDIESFEYQTITNIIQSGYRLPNQIAVEMHIDVKTQHADLYKSQIHLLTFVNYLHLFGGYHLIDRHDNDVCATCSELLFARASCDNRRLSISKQGVGILLDEKEQTPLFSKAIKDYFEKKLVV